MPQATFVQDGMSIDYTPGAAVPAGEVVVQGEPDKPIRVDITVLKDVFIDRQMPGYGGPGEFE